MPAVHPEKKTDGKYGAELELYEEEEKRGNLEDLDRVRQELMAQDEEFGNMLEKIVTDIRIGIKPPQPKMFQKTLLNDPI
jgi:hypothetical protein